MADYIERVVAFNAILKLVPKVDGDGYCWVIRGDAARAIDSIPSADVQPVVRCRDCSVPVGGFCGKLGGYPPDKDFYCAFGISKDGGT